MELKERLTRAFCSEPVKCSPHYLHNVFKIHSNNIQLHLGMIPVAARSKA
jgi:hypothetical protein